MQRKKQSLLLLSAILLLGGIASRVQAQTASDVTFDTVAMSYPYDKKVKIQIIGTERFAKNIKGEADIERRKSVTLIRIDLGRLPPPSQLGPAFTTYVIWAITPEGLADNIGEFRQRTSETLDNLFGSEITTATPHRTFSLIITAEPHYLVSSPSRLVVAANQPMRDFGVKTYQNRIGFSGDSDFERVLVAPDPAAERKDPKYPIELLQARNAIEISRFYQSEIYSEDLLKQAQTAFDRGESINREGKREEAIEAADLSIRLADSARKLAVSRRKARDLRDLIAEKDESLTRLEDDLRNISQSGKDAQTRLDDEVRKRKSAERENDRLLREFDVARRETEVERNAKALGNTELSRLQQENERLREELDKTQKAVTVAERDRQTRELREQVTKLYETRNETKGLVVILPDRFFENENSSNITAEASFKLDPLVKLLKQIGNNIVIESYTDNRGAQDARFKLTQGRAQAILNFLIARGVAQERVQAFANGGSNAKADNRTPKGREANRRIELTIVEGTSPSAISAGN